VFSHSPERRGLQERDDLPASQRRIDIRGRGPTFSAMRTTTTARGGSKDAPASSGERAPAQVDAPGEASRTGPEVGSSAAPEAASAGAPAKKVRGRDPLLAAICHDLRAPLAAVTMGANFVLQTTPDDEANSRSRRVLQAILRSCKQMERLVRNFGDLSEIEGDAVELRLDVHDAGEMLEIAGDTARPNAVTRNIVVEVSRPATPLLLRCDRDRMLRALGHVIDNAVRFSPDGGTVSLIVSATDGTVQFTVTDHGTGISEETLANLYDRTWHAKRAGRVGSGLGLAIVRGFVLAHGGRVDVDSKAGGPTTFTLVLPKDGPATSENLDETTPTPAPTH
jgi:signal transduction histidine kinase